MTDEERAALNGRLLALELLMQGTLSIIASHLPKSPAALHQMLDSTLLVLEQTRVLGNPGAVQAQDVARDAITRLRTELERLPAMRAAPGREMP